MSSLNELRSVLRTIHINMLSTLFFFINISTGKTTGSARRFSFSRLFFPAFFSAFCPCFFLSFFARTFHLPFSEPVLSVTFAASFLMLLSLRLFYCFLPPFFGCRFLLRFFCLSLPPPFFAAAKKHGFRQLIFFIIFRYKTILTSRGTRANIYIEFLCIDTL